MTREVEALVANVLDTYRIALNVGEDQGVEQGDAVTIWRVVEVTDPTTGETLGNVRLDKLRLDVTFTSAKFCVASSKTSGGVLSGSFASAFGTRKRISSSSTRGGAGDDVVIVRVGDEATVYVSDQPVAGGTLDTEEL